MRYEVVAVHVNGGQDQAGHEHHQAKGQAAQAVERRLPGPQGQDQLLIVLLKDKQQQKKPVTHECFKPAERRLPRCCGLNEPTPEIAAGANGDAAAGGRG